MSEQYIQPGIVPNLPPFEAWLASNIPAVYDNTMSYYEELTALIKYLEDTVIPAVNTTGESVVQLQGNFTALTQQFNTLKSYVEHYFDNLDVQTEINNKLDAMVTDGTLGAIIEPYLTAFEAEIRAQVATIGDISNLDTTVKTDIVAGVNCANENYSGILREQYGNMYSPVDLSEGISFFSDNVTIYKDRQSNNYTYYCNLEKHKNTGGTNIYVDPWTDVSVGEQDGTESKPYNKVSTAYAAASNGDTLVLASGVYSRMQTGNFNLTKSINIVAKDGEPNKVFCTMSDELTWVANDTYSNVYETTRSNTLRVVDIRNRDRDQFAELIRVDSLESCSTTLNSYYISGAGVYVNIGETVDGSKVRALIQVEPCFRIGNNGADTNVYFENITFLGGHKGFVSVIGSDNYDCMFTAKNCNFYYSKGVSYDAISVEGANTLFYRCKACFAEKDGFNYHATGSRYCKNIEIECVGANNGTIGDVTTYNGSTTHAGNKILRINGVYFNNHGANVCDVGTNTVSINIGCKSFDSICASSSAKADFNAQQAGTAMKLYNCYSKGSRSRFNIYAITGTTIDVYNCQYDRTGGDGTITVH